jgi:hypothetical protein
MSLFSSVRGIGRATNAPLLSDFDVKGRWKTDEGEVDISQSGQTVTAKFRSGGDCPFGAKRTIFFTGEVGDLSCGVFGDNCEAPFSGTLYRCTKSEELLKECQLEPVYEVPFHGSAGWQIITGKFKNEHYSKKTKKDEDKPDNANDEQQGCKWTRDPSGDKEFTFTFTRWHTPAWSSKKCTGRRC